jgi:hypothetical protein
VASFCGGGYEFWGDPKRQTKRQHVDSVTGSFMGYLYIININVPRVSVVGLRHYVESLKAAGSIPDEVFGFWN